VKNYVIVDIDSPNQAYPKHEGIKFKPLKEYLDEAKKAIIYFTPNGTNRNILANSEDAIANVAYEMMIADWRFKEGKGKSQRDFRFLSAKYAILDFLQSFKKKKNRKNISLDQEIGKEGSPLYQVISNTEDDPFTKIREQERKSRIKQKLEFAIANANLSKIQKECIRLKYFNAKPNGDPLTYAEVGKMLNPPITRQAVKQNIDRSLERLKSVLKS